MRTDIRAARSVAPHLETPKAKRPLAFRLLLALLTVEGLAGFGGGLAFIAAPNGTLMGLELSVLQDAPVGSFLLPGFILALPLGLIPLIIAWDLAHHRRHSWASRAEGAIGASLGWVGSLAVGMGLIVWLVVEYLMIGYHWLQVAMGLVGIGITALTLLPSLRRRFTIVNDR
jgi:hypothetical protein